MKSTIHVERVLLAYSGVLESMDNATGSDRNLGCSSSRVKVCRQLWRQERLSKTTDNILSNNCGVSQRYQGQSHVYIDFSKQRRVWSCVQTRQELAKSHVFYSLTLNREQNSHRFIDKSVHLPPAFSFELLLQASHTLYYKSLLSTISL